MAINSDLRLMRIDQPSSAELNRAWGGQLLITISKRQLWLANEYKLMNDLFRILSGGHDIHVIMSINAIFKSFHL